MKIAHKEKISYNDRGENIYFNIYFKTTLQISGKYFKATFHTAAVQYCSTAAVTTTAPHHTAH